MAEKSRGRSERVTSRTTKPRSRSASAASEATRGALARAAKGKPVEAKPATRKPTPAGRSIGNVKSAREDAVAGKGRVSAKGSRARAAGPMGLSATEALRRPLVGRTRQAPTASRETAPTPASALNLTDEERIESSKYESAEPKRRVFEEERFLFPETYDSDRVRLLVKDPEWLFAHWDVSPSSWSRVKSDVGERALAMSRLTLKVEDPADGALSVVLLPEGVRSWYLRTHRNHRAYRAQLGLTMPSGEFKQLATSNVVVTPRVGASPARVTRRVSFGASHDDPGVLAAAVELASAAAESKAARVPRAKRAAGPALIDGAAIEQPGGGPGSASEARGGASDVFVPSGASDAFRR